MPGREKEPLARLVAYIAMMPAAHIDDKVRAERRMAFATGRGSGHNPRKVRRGKKCEGCSRPQYRAPAGSQRVRANGYCSQAQLLKLDPRWALV